MKRLSVWALLGSLFSCSTTGGTETDNPASPLQDFSSSECKTKAASPGQQALLLQSETEGLQCVEWEEQEGGSLLVRLSNFPTPCAETYLGKAALADDGALELSVYKDTCDVFRCGTCVFDFDFEVEVPLDTALTLRAGSASCASEPITFSDELTLPVDSAASGALCRPLVRGAVEQYGRARGSCGERNMPCGDCSSADVTTCADDLVCTELSVGDARCLAPCESDDDCVGGLTTCQGGACQPLSSF